jgi:hypothetical protein
MHNKIPVSRTSNGLHIHASKYGSGLKLVRHHVKRGRGPALLLSSKAGSGINELSDKLNVLSFKQPKKSNIKFIL